MNFQIRAELQDGTFRDFTAAGEDSYTPVTSARLNARRAAETELRKSAGGDAKFIWLGMVVFVNRPVPFADRKPDLARYPLRPKPLAKAGAA